MRMSRLHAERMLQQQVRFCVRDRQVVFSAGQLSWLSAEQGWAVTEEQWAELNTEQKHAVQRARYEGDVLLGLRGVSLKKKKKLLQITSFKKRKYRILGVVLFCVVIHFY